MVEMLRRNLESRAKAYGMEALANDTEVSRQALHSFFKGGDMKLSNLEKLVQRLGWSLSLDPVDTSKDVLGNLKEYGAPLVADQPHVYYSLEEALYKALEFSREDARIASVLPYFLLQRAYKLNSDKLFS